MGASSSKSIRTLQGHTGGVYAVAISPDGEGIVSGSGDESVRVWRLDDGTAVRTLKGHTDSVMEVAISPDGQWIVSGSYDNSVRVWRLGSL